MSHSLELIAQAQALLSTVKDAETGQRGYLLTGAERYLDPYTVARTRLPASLGRLRELTGSAPRDRQRLDAIAALTTDKLSELAETIQLRREGKTDAARSLVESDRGKAAMDRIRASVEAIVSDENAALDARQAEWQDTVRSSAFFTVGGSLLLIALIVAAAAAASRDYRVQKRQEWLRAGQVGLSQVVAGEPRLDVQADIALAFLADYLQAKVGALPTSPTRPEAHAVPGGASPSATRLPRACSRLAPTLLAQAAKIKRPWGNVPEGYLPITSATGGAPSREVLKPKKKRARNAALRAKSSRCSRRNCAPPTRSSKSSRGCSRSRRRPWRTSRPSSSRPTSNWRSRRRSLETQNGDDCSSAQARLLEQRAGELEQASQYKSEFLANMSHELRTPLNSSLILAKLLADNKAGNLNAEQVRFAQTISLAGNDLLTLINDILDLSKIEAGKVELQPEDG